MIVTGCPYELDPEVVTVTVGEFFTIVTVVAGEVAGLLFASPGVEAVIVSVPIGSEGTVSVATPPVIVPVPIAVPRDRHGSFEPQLVKKGQRLAEWLARVRPAWAGHQWLRGPAVTLALLLALALAPLGRTLATLHGGIDERADIAVAALQPALDQIEAAQDDGQHVVEVMRDAARKLADGLQALRLSQCRFRVRSRRDFGIQLDGKPR